MAMNDKLTTIKPLPAPLDGVARVPGDKSISHRAILFSAMAEGTSRVTGVLDSADVRSSIAAVRALGADVNLSVQADGSLAGGITGWGASGPHQPEGVIDCGNSGTTVRLLMGVVAPWDIHAKLTGDDSLRRRPMRRIITPLTKMGVKFEPEEAETLPLTVIGNPGIKAITYDSPVASAQVKTAVMLAGTRADGLTTVNEPAPSRNHTELMLPEFGVETTASLSSASVKGPVILRASEVDVPGDPSSAAFLACAALLKPGSAVQIENVSLASTRTGFIRTLERMGGSIEVRFAGAEGKEPKGMIEVAYTPNLVGCEVPPQHIASEIDEIPVLSLVAARAKGITVFRSVNELTKKESNRLEAIIEALDKIGVSAWTESRDDEIDLFIEGQPELQYPAGLTFDSYGDHRLAMTWSLVGMCGSHPVDIVDFECVKVSFPSFASTMERLCS